MNEIEIKVSFIKFSKNYYINKFYYPFYQIYLHYFQFYQIKNIKKVISK